MANNPHPPVPTSDGPSSSNNKLVCTAILPLQPKTIQSSNNTTTRAPTNEAAATTTTTTLTFIEHQPAWSLDFSPDGGSHLAVCYGAPHPCIRVFAAIRTRSTTTTEVSCWHRTATLVGMQARTIRCVAFAPIQRPLTLAAASFDGTIAIWERQQAQQNTSRTSSSSSSHHDEEEEEVWDCVAQLEGHENECKHVAWNATGTLLVSCGRDKTVWIWEAFLTGSIGGPSGDDAAADFECLSVLNGHEGDVKCVSFAPSHDQWGDGDEIVLSGSYDHTIRIWAEDAGDWFCAAVLDQVHAATVWSLTVAPSGRRFLSASADQSIAIHRCYTSTAEEKNATAINVMKKAGKPSWVCVGKLPDAHGSVIYHTDYAPSRAGHGRVVSAGADSAIRVYREAVIAGGDAPQFSIDATASVDGGDVHCVKWHPWDGGILASAEDSGTVRIWKYTA